MKPAACLAGAVLLLAAVATAAQPRPRIVGGSATGDFAPVGALLIYAAPNDPRIVSLCSGTLVGCRSFLTAAHCVCPTTSDDAASCLRQGLADPRELDVFFPHAGRVAVESVFLHPDYVFTAGGDLALLRLDAAPAWIDPAAVNRAGRPAPGSDGVIVGFGNTGGPEFAQSDFGIKRFGPVRTSACASGIEADTHLCWEYLDTGANTCGGDSGGPLFIDAGGGVSVAGITSGGQNPTCLAPDAGFDTDLFVHGDWLEAAIAASEDGLPCPAGPRLGDPGIAADTVAGTLRRSETTRVVPFTVPPGTATLLVTLNGALYNPDDAITVNDFGLAVARAGGGAPVCRDPTDGPFDACVIDAPAPGGWEARIQRLRGFGEFQLTVTTAARVPCAGDCNDDGAVDEDELALAVAALFDAGLVPACETLDGDGDGVVNAGELVRAVRNAAGECSP